MPELPMDGVQRCRAEEILGRNAEVGGRITWYELHTVLDELERQAGNEEGRRLQAVEIGGETAEKIAAEGTPCKDDLVAWQALIETARHAANAIGATGNPSFIITKSPAHRSHSPD